MVAAHRVTVITVCAGLPPVGTIPTRYDLLTGSSNPRRRMEQRRREDRRAMKVLGARSTYLDFLDVPYRSEQLAPEVVKREVCAALPRDASCIAVPAGLGAHPDHLLTAAAGDSLQRDYRVITFADYPYAAVYGWPSWVNPAGEAKYLHPEASWTEALKRSGSHAETEAVVVTLSRDDQKKKLETFANYTTQVAATEEGPSRLVSHPERIRFEVFWRPRG